MSHVIVGELLAACGSGDLRVVVKILREHRILVNSQRTEDGATPLIFASQGGHETTARFLLEKGAFSTWRPETEPRP